MMEMYALIPSRCSWVIPYLVLYTWTILPTAVNKLLTGSNLGEGHSRRLFRREESIIKAKARQSVSDCSHLGRSGKKTTKCLCTGFFFLLFFLVPSSSSPLGMMLPTLEAGLSQNTLSNAPKDMIH